MFGRAMILLAIPASALATPVAAQAPAPTTAFDGKYVGVSRESSKAGSTPGAKCLPRGVPDTLTITNGVVRSKVYPSWEGAVNPQGALVMRSTSSMRVDAQIDPQGTIRGQYSGPACIYTYVWQKGSR